MVYFADNENITMRPTSLREKLHTVIDILPATKVTEIYYVLFNNYREEFKSAVKPLKYGDEVTAGEADLIMQQLLA